MTDAPRQQHDTVDGAPPPSVLVRLMPLPQSDTPAPAGEACPDAPPDAPARYELRRLLGKGGVGVVYLGHDVELGRDVAVKFLQAQHAGRDDLESRFLEEAQIGGQLEHPGIVPVYDVGLAGRQPFFAMKLIRGKALHLLLLERTSPQDDLTRLIAIFEQVCHAVGYAHARGVVHRDLKPSNVMIGAFGEVQVVDWGMGKVMPGPAVAPASAAPTPVGEGAPHPKVRTVRSAESTPSADSQGAVLGTPAYMPPEQARGDSDRTGPWSDVFALGGMLCEILTGRPPYTGRARRDETFAEAILREAITADLEDCHRRLEACDADAELVALCKACLAASPAARPATAQDIARRVADHRAGVEARAHRERLRAVVARTRVRQLGTFIALLVLVLAATVYFMREAQAQRERADREAGEAKRAAKIATQERATARLAEAAARQAEETAKQSEATAKAAEAAAKRAEGMADARAADARREREQAVLARNEADVQRAAAVAAAAAERSAQAQEKEAHRKEAMALRAAREERAKAEARARRDAYAARIGAADAALRRGDPGACAQFLAECDADLRGFEWRHLDLQVDRSLETVWVGAPLTALASAPGLHVVASTDGRLRAFRGTPPVPRGEVTAHAGGVFALAIAPDGRAIASGGADGALRLWDPLTLRALTTLRAEGTRITTLAFAPTGDRLACGGFDEVVRVFGLPSGLLQAELPGHRGGASCITFLGDHLLVGTATGLLHEYDADHRSVSEVVVHDDAIVALASHEVTGAVAVGTLDGRIVLRSRADAAASRTLRVADTGATALAFTPDGAMLASGHTDHRVRSWDVASGTLLAAAPGHRDVVTGLTFTVDRDGAPRIVSASADGSLRLWALRSGEAAYVFEERRPQPGTTALAALDHGILGLSPQGVRALAWDGDALQVRTATFEEAATSMTDAPWHAGARWLADADLGAPIAIAVAAGGRQIGAIVGDGQAAWAWRSDDAVPRRWAVPQVATCVGLTDVALILGTAAGDVLALDAAGVRVLRPGSARIDHVAPAATGRCAAILALGQPLEILDLASGTSTFVALRGSMRLGAVATDARGTRVAVGSDDGTITLIDAASGGVLIELRGRQGAVRQLAWAADGHRLLARFADGAVACFDDSLASARILWSLADATQAQRGPQPIAIRPWP